MSVEGLCEDVNILCDPAGRPDISGGICLGNERLHFREGEGADQVLLLRVRPHGERNDCKGGDRNTAPEMSPTSGPGGGRGGWSQSDKLELNFYLKSKF